MLADHEARLTEADASDPGMTSAYQHGNLVVSRSSPVAASPAAASAAASSGHGGKWATSEDWAVHKDTIVRLYWNEDRTLKEVMNIMARDYDFHGTVKMYKSRFKVWGLAKNIVKEDASRIMMAAWSGERPNAPVLQGRKLGSKRFRKQLQTARELGVRVSPKSAEFYTTPPPTPVQYQQQMMMASGSSSPTSLSHRLWQPDVLGQSEQTIRAIHSYTDFCLETKVWELSSVEADHALNFPKGRSFKIFVVSNSMSTTSMWWMELRTAARLLKQSRNSPAAFRIIDNCLERTGSLIDYQDPTFITATMSVVLQLEEFAQELATSLLRYIYHLSVVKLGAHHPLSSFWAHMRSLGVQNARHAAESTLRAHYDTLQRQMHPEDIKYWGSDATPGTGGRRLARYSDFSVDQMPSSNFVRIMHDMEADPTSVVDDIYIGWCQIMLSYFLEIAAAAEKSSPNRFVAKDADADAERVIKVEDDDGEGGAGLDRLHKLEPFEED